MAVDAVGQLLPEEFQGAFPPDGILPGVAPGLLEILPEGIFKVRLIILPGAHFCLIDKGGIVRPSPPSGVDELLEELQQDVQADEHGAGGQELSEGRPAADQADQVPGKVVRRQGPDHLRQEPCENQRHEPSVQLPHLLYGEKVASRCRVFLFLPSMFAHVPSGSFRPVFSSFFSEMLFFHEMLFLYEMLFFHMAPSRLSLF